MLAQKPVCTITTTLQVTEKILENAVRLASSHQSLLVLSENEDKQTFIVSYHMAEEDKDKTAKDGRPRVVQRAEALYIDAIVLSRQVRLFFARAFAFRHRQCLSHAAVLTETCSSAVHAQRQCKGR